MTRPRHCWSASPCFQWQSPFWASGPQTRPSGTGQQILMQCEIWAWAYGLRMSATDHHKPSKESLWNIISSAPIPGWSKAWYPDVHIKIAATEVAKMMFIPAFRWSMVPLLLIQYSGSLRTAVTSFPDHKAACNCGAQARLLLDFIIGQVYVGWKWTGNPGFFLHFLLHWKTEGGLPINSFFNGTSPCTSSGAAINNTMS